MLSKLNDIFISNPYLSFFGISISLFTIYYLFLKKKKPSHELLSWYKGILKHSKLLKIKNHSNDSPLRYVLGTLPNMELSRNMVLYRLPSGKIWIHSGFAFNDEVRDEIEEWNGTPSYFCIPSLVHTLDVRRFAQQYPEMTFLYPNNKVLEKVVPKIGNNDDRYQFIDPNDENEVNEYIRPIIPKGCKKLSSGAVEYIFEVLIPETHGVGLVINDIFFHDVTQAIESPLIRGENYKMSYLGNIILLILGSKGSLHASRLSKKFLINNKKIFKNFLLELIEKYDKPINEGGIEFIITSHGVPIIGREECIKQLKSAYDLL